MPDMWGSCDAVFFLKYGDHAKQFLFNRPVAVQPRLPNIKCGGNKLMLPHFAESLRELGRLGGGLDDDGEVDSQPWLLGCAQV